MYLKSYLKQNNLKVSVISRTSGVPYTTVSEIINGKIDIDRVQIGTGMKIAEVCNLSFDEFYNMCKRSSVLPEIKEGHIRRKNKSYYLQYDFPDANGEVYLCKVNEDNTRYIKDMAEWELNDIKAEIKRRKDIAEVESWTRDSI